MKSLHKTEASCESLRKIALVSFKELAHEHCFWLLLWLKPEQKQMHISFLTEFIKWTEFSNQWLNGSFLHSFPGWYSFLKPSILITFPILKKFPNVKDRTYSILDLLASLAAGVQTHESGSINEHSNPTCKWQLVRERRDYGKSILDTGSNYQWSSMSGAGVGQGYKLWKDQGPAQQCLHRLKFKIVCSKPYNCCGRKNNGLPKMPTS